MTKVLMVCLGNICRSPLAEGILKSKVDPEKVVVDSAGTAGYHVGNPPDPRSIAVASKYGIDIGRQRCRKLTKEDLDHFDHIYVMDKSNLANASLLAESSTQQQKITLLLHEGNMPVDEVPDPYYGGAQGFEHVFQLIDAACSAIAAKLS